MVSLELNQDHCIRCGRCISVCPQRILGRHTNGSVDVLHGALARCIRCGHCVAVCPKAALTLEHIAPSSLPLVEDAPLSDLQRDMLFKTRRSTRAYKDEPVDRNVLLKALEEARYAPTASNCEEVAWLLVEGRDRLHDLCPRGGLDVDAYRKIQPCGIGFPRRAGSDPAGGPLPHPRARRRQHAVERSRLCRRRQLSGARPAQLRHRDLLERFRHRRSQQRCRPRHPSSRRPQNLRRAHDRVPCRPVCPCSPAQARAFDGHRVNHWYVPN